MKYAKRFMLVKSNQKTTQKLKNQNRKTEKFNKPPLRAAEHPIARRFRFVGYTLSYPKTPYRAKSCHILRICLGISLKMPTFHLPAISCFHTHTHGHTEGRFKVLYYAWVDFKSQKPQKETTRLHICTRVYISKKCVESSGWRNVLQCQHL